LQSFSTRSVSENFNESKSTAFSIYNVLFTCLLVIPIVSKANVNETFTRGSFQAMLQQGVVPVVELASFALFWIGVITCESLILCVFSSSLL